jgi:hypothetical protein
MMPKDDGRSFERADEDPQIDECLSLGGGLTWGGERGGTWETRGGGGGGGACQE